MAAVTVESAAVSFRLPRSCSMCGAPSRIQRKQGTKVTHVVMSAPRVPARRGGKRPGLVPSAHETDKLQHHDQRARSCFGQSKAVHHLAGLEPAEILHRLLRDIRQHRVGATESDHRGFAKEKAFLEKRVVPSQPEADEKNRHPPKRQANQRDSRRARPRRPRMARGFLVITENAVFPISFARRDDDELVRPKPSSDEPQERRRRAQSPGTEFRTRKCQ